MHTNDSKPVVTVAVISDFAAGEDRAWDDMRACLRAVAVQDFSEPVEYLLLESAGNAGAVPADLYDILPGMRLVVCAHDASYEIKNEAAEAASADLLMLLDADCVPEPNWLRVMVEDLRAHPEAVVVSSKTEYLGRTLTERILSLLSRSFLDPGGFGETRFISNNSSLFRRDALLANPLPTGLGPFAARLQMEAFRRQGKAMLFEPRTRVVHGFDGWPMERDIRRNFGYGAVLLRLVDRRMPHAWLVRLGMFSIPLFVVLRTIDSWWNCLRVGTRYGVARYQLPIALAVAVYVHLLEISGMVMAFRGKPKPASSFR